MKPRLIFVYNAKADFVSKAVDFAHKIISPETYSCELCALTYDSFTIKKQWKVYLDTLPHAKVFYYEEHWKKSSAFFKVELPVILFQKNKTEKPEIVLSKHEMQQIKDNSGLIKAIKKKLSVVYK